MEPVANALQESRAKSFSSEARFGSCTKCSNQLGNVPIAIHKSQVGNPSSPLLGGMNRQGNLPTQAIFVTLVVLPNGFLVIVIGIAFFLLVLFDRLPVRLGNQDSLFFGYGEQVCFRILLLRYSVTEQFFSCRCKNILVLCVGRKSPIDTKQVAELLGGRKVTVNAKKDHPTALSIVVSNQTHVRSINVLDHHATQAGSRESLGHLSRG
mmetsp:Transcript_6358/g.17912  ORF Transcript_6358/g.17912 Transcript_6358/m.17912 type:complete len:209 (-) Transcript_6358:230-856(-)